MTDFELDPRLAADTVAVTNLSISSVRLMNDARYPWLVLIPARAGMVEIIDLSEQDQLRLYDDIRHCARALQAHCQPDKLNIAALGNQVAQLHVHVIARFKTDAAWPAPVWGAHPPLPYPDHGHQLAEALRARLLEKQNL